MIKMKLVMHTGEESKERVVKREDRGQRGGRE